MVRLRLEGRTQWLLSFNGGPRYTSEWNNNVTCALTSTRSSTYTTTYCTILSAGHEPWGGPTAGERNLYEVLDTRLGLNSDGHVGGAATSRAAKRWQGRFALSSVERLLLTSLLAWGRTRSASHGALPSLAHQLGGDLGVEPELHLRRIRRRGPAHFD